MASLEKESLQVEREKEKYLIESIKYIKGNEKYLIESIKSINGNDPIKHFLTELIKSVKGNDTFLSRLEEREMIIRQKIPEKMFKKGKVYKICSKTTDKVYVGSTIEALKTQMSYHLRDANNPLSAVYAILKYDDYYVELIEDYPCKNDQELRKREQYWMNKLNSVNRAKRVKCQCGKPIARGSLNRHLKTKEHTKRLAGWRPKIKKHQYHCHFCPPYKWSLNSFCVHCTSKKHDKNKDILLQSIINKELSFRIG